MTNTTIYFDVDGVFNAVTSKPNPALAGWSEYEFVNVEGYPIRYAPELVTEINRITALPNVEPKWLTTWCDLAPKSLAPAIGLAGEDWTVVGERAMVNHRALEWWKLPLIQRDVEATVPEQFAWFDDDIWVSGKSTRTWTNSVLEKAMIVAPNTRVGITRDMIVRLEEFITGL